MSQQHQKWNHLVMQAMEKRGWSKADLAQAVGLKRTSSAISELFSEGKGSVDLKLKISKLLSIREPWEEFEE